MRGASPFKYSTFTYKKELAVILNKIVLCYFEMLSKYANEKVENNENLIRNRLYIDYLKNSHIKKKYKLDQYMFFPEVNEYSSNYREIGRTDIRIILNNKSFVDDDYYYTIECKRLDGKKHLNEEYVKEGLLRFVGPNPKYKSHLRVNGVIGFIVKPSQTSKIIEDINLILKSEKYNKLIDGEIAKKNLNIDDDFLYQSKHSNSPGLKREHSTASDLTLYHLMLDFSNIVA